MWRELGRLEADFLSINVAQDEHLHELCLSF